MAEADSNYVSEKKAPLADSRGHSKIIWQRLRSYLPETSFITLHYLYFCGTCLVASIIFWGSSTPFKSVSYMDSLFLCISAMTEAGLNTVNLSTLNTWQQVMLFLLIIMGSAVFVSIAIIHIRKTAFEKRLEELAERHRRRTLRPRLLSFTISKRRASGTGQREDAIIAGAVRGRPILENTVDDSDKATAHSPHEPESRIHTSVEMDPRKSSTDGQNQNAHIKFDDDTNGLRRTTSNLRPIRRTGSNFFNGSGVGAHRHGAHPREARKIDYWANADESAIEDDPPENSQPSNLDKYLKAVGGYIGRNSQFHHLSERDRKKLGGIEYDAICMLSWVIPAYFILWQLISAVGLGAWFLVNLPNKSLEDGINPFWTGAFFSISAFNNSGMALLDANATVLQGSYYPLLTLSVLILAGNTCFPPFLRLILWTMKKGIPDSYQSIQWQKRRQVLNFILDHPRRVYTNLFPAQQTWWLVCSLVILNGIDWIAFEILNIGNPVTDAIPPRSLAIDGLFQALAVRCGGFYVINISSLRSGLLVLYVLMMYVSAFPVTMTIRNTNVYEERSLGVYSEETPETDEATKKGTRKGLVSGLKRTMTLTHGQSKPTMWSRQDFIRQQVRSQLGHDLWWIAIAVLLITIIETGQFERDPVVFSTFNIIFEVISAYGTVGISTGVPWNAYSFCGAWHSGSKLVLCAVMLRGRHRGLPVAIDRAILLPSESLAWAEEEDAHKRSASAMRTARRPSTTSGNDLV